MEEKVSQSFCQQEIGCEPNVLGHRILLKAPELPEKTAGGLYLAEQTKHRESMESSIGLVLKIGNNCFGGSFSSLKCNVGDWIEYSTAERTKSTPNKKKCYYINDDRILAIVPPEDVKAYVAM